MLQLFLSRPEKRSELFADTAAVAKLVGVSRRTVQLWIEVGEIRALRIGHRYQIFLESVHDYLEDGQVLYADP